MPNLVTLAHNAYLAKSEPMSLVHFVTNRCNARCSHCFLDFDNPKTFEGELTLEEIDRLTRHLGGSLLNVNITGGEPLLRRDLFEVIECYFRNAGVESVFITSNGAYPDRLEKLIDRFVDSGIRGRMIFSFSIDNFPEEHDRHRKVAGLFDKTLESYAMVRDANREELVANIAITVTDHNHDRVVDIYHHLKNDRDVRAFTAIAMREEGVVTHIEDETKMAIHAAYSELTVLIRADLESGRTSGYERSLIGRMLNAKNLVLYDLMRDIYRHPGYRSHCPSAALFGVIYANGDVYPCEILEDTKLGSLRDYDMDFMRLWRDRSAADCRRFIKDTRCNCSYECALGINIISNARYIPRLAGHLARGVVR
jgi:MoaA/NifB/PqqE/SkfB family radical SAM enzyme